MITEVSYEDVLRIRHEVLYPNKDTDYVKLPDDEKGIHMGYFVEEKPVSILSLFLADNKLQFRKFATLINQQNKGYGTKLMQSIIDYAKDMKFESIWCNARYDKVDFYKKFDFEETDNRYVKDGITFIVLEKRTSK